MAQFVTQQRGRQLTFITQEICVYLLSHRCVFLHVTLQRKGRINVSMSVLQKYWYLHVLYKSKCECSIVWYFFSFSHLQSSLQCFCSAMKLHANTSDNKWYVLEATIRGPTTYNITCRTWCYLAPLSSHMWNSAGNGEKRGWSRGVKGKLWEWWVPNLCMCTN